MNTFDCLKQLSEAAGPSGHEAAVAQTIRELWVPFVDEIHTDALGNLITLQKAHPAQEGTAPTLMVATHMDEVALIVTAIEDGFLRVAAIGGADPRVLLGREVIVHGRHALPGIIGSYPPHVLSQEARKHVVPWEQLFVDVGLSPEEITTEVQVGDPITIHQGVSTLKNGRIAGKAMDNRASIAALTLALEALHTQEHTWDLYAVATVQEEFGMGGAITSAYGIHPDLAIAIDATFAIQADDSAPGAFEIDQGPTIGVGPNFHPQIVRDLRKIAEAEEIPYQIEPLSGHSGTDAWEIQVAREGIPTALLSIPLRYMHQPVETLALRDVERTARLLTAFVAGLPTHYRPQWEDA